MEEKETANKSEDPSIPTEQSPEETHEMVEKNSPETPADESLRQVYTGGIFPTVRIVNFLFWSNFASVLLLLVGFVAPGWLTLITEHQLTYIPSSYNGLTRHIDDIYQDYGLWYITQCDFHDNRNVECETMTYRTIDAVYAEESTRYEKLKIGDLENEGGDKFMFHEAALVFGFSKFVQVQTLYTIGLLISLVLLYRWYNLRKDVAKGSWEGSGKWIWIFLILLTILAVILVFIVVFIFVGVRGVIGELDVDLRTPFGLLFAVFGGLLLAVVAVAELIQVFCCFTNAAPN